MCNHSGEAKTVLTAALKQIAHERPGFVQDLSAKTGLSDSTIYRWLTDLSEPDLFSLLVVFRHCDADAQRKLLGAFAAGSDWAFYRPPMDRDADGDGRITLADALAHAITANRRTARHLDSLHKEVCKRDGIDDTERARLHLEIDDAVEQLLLARAVIDAEHERGSRRRKARRG